MEEHGDPGNHTRQYRDDILIASTRSYIPNGVDLKALRAMLKEEEAMIYGCLKQLGADPVDCQENLISSLPNDTERDLNLPQDASISIVRIVRKAFEPDGRCVQVCYMVDRADCYEFEYSSRCFKRLVFGQVLFYLICSKKDWNSITANLGRRM
ncbi:hypothetical protein [Laceyella putida]|uniref:Uncharacterized protein n=1 Tax=Laceyella putida TaxID=110101 RepID=A0ABW2RMV0_9BACL